MTDQLQNSSPTSQEELKNQFSQHLLDQYPDLNQHPDFQNLISPHMISPYVVSLPIEVLHKVKSFVEASFRLRTSLNYRDFHQPEIQQRGLRDPGNFAICMSYDFHIDSENNPRLIEINTNAAFLAMGYEMYQWRKLPQPVSGFKIDEFKLCLESEVRLAGKNSLKKIAIIDEEPSQQRLFVEFLLYQQIFQGWGYETKISDYRQLESADLVYNRFTDFYFENELAAHLRQKFLNRETVFSPNPYEYFLLADKQRLIEWSDESFWQQMKSESNSAEIQKILQRYLPHSRSVQSDNAEEIWSQRKKLFFKPKRAFGSKQSYKGASISRKVFDDILAGDFIAQEYVAAPETSFQPNSLSEKLFGQHEAQNFKYDLRFYVYRDQVQMVVARLYQGQVTNAKTLGGGFSPVIFT